MAAAPPAMSPQKPGDHFSPGIAKAGVLHHQQQPRHWIPDQRDAFTGWLRGEFAAANAIIDALCQHLQLIGAPGEYDFVLGSIQQRRFSWNGVLHMQQYFSVAEVLFSLQHVIARKQQHSNGNHAKQSQHKVYTSARRDFPNQRRSQERPKFGNVQPEIIAKKEVLEDEARKVSSVPLHAQAEDDGSRTNPSSQTQQQQQQQEEEEVVCDSVLENCVAVADKNPKQEESLMELGRFKAAEAATVEEVVETDQKVNLAEGELYNQVFRGAELVDLTTDLQNKSDSADQSCIRGKLQTSTEIYDSVREKTPRSVPDFVQSVVDHLCKTGLLRDDTKPNYFIMNVIEEGKSSSIEEPNGLIQPLCLVSLLSDCSLVLGKSSSSVSLPAGSLLKLGEFRNPVTYAINAAPVKRILLFLGIEKQQLRKASSSSSSSSPSSTTTTASSSKQVPASNCGQGSSSPSSFQHSWQARPGTGVYIPGSSSSSKCDFAMGYRTCIQT